MTETFFSSSSESAETDGLQAGSSTRQSMMATLAAASPDKIADAYDRLGSVPEFDLVRQPETGLVMVRGRMGGTGSPFNLGEVTVTRCVIRLQTGEAGSSYALGRHKQKALQTAVIDALWQRPEERMRIETDVIAPLREAQEEADRDVGAETAATKVDFFTMVRGDD